MLLVVLIWAMSSMTAHHPQESAIVLIGMYLMFVPHTSSLKFSYCEFDVEHICMQRFPEVETKVRFVVKKAC